MTLSDDYTPLIEKPDPKHHVVMCAMPDESGRPSPEQLRAENAASPAPSWTPVEYSWRTRRWWPSRQGWWPVLLPVSGMILTGRVLTAGGNPLPLIVSLGVPLAAFALLLLPAIALIEMIPSNHQRTTAKWTIRFGADAVTFEERASGSPARTVTIPRSEAGRIEISLIQDVDRGGHPMDLYGVDQVTAFALDEASSITLARHMTRRVNILLLAWWPKNGLSRPSLEDPRLNRIHKYGY